MKLLSNITSTTIDPDVYKITVVILIIIMSMVFILTILRYILEHKLKNKMLEKGVSENLASSILQKDAHHVKHLSVKWVLVLLATGIGLFITNQFLPLGLHSMGIMVICIGLGFLGNVLYLNRFTE